MVKVKSFSSILRAKINHLIQLLVISTKVKETWTKGRKVIFNQVLLGATLPKEAVGTGFF